MNFILFINLLASTIISQNEETTLLPDQNIINGFDCSLKENRKQLNEYLMNQIESEKRNWFTKFHNYTEIIDWYIALQNEFKEFSKIRVMGTTKGEKDMYAFHIKLGSDNMYTPPSTKVIWLQSLIHAREWVTGPVLDFTILKLLTKLRQGDSTITEYFQGLELIAIPVVNPDGYEFSLIPGNELWRKNRQPLDDGQIGVDLNRNFPYDWNVFKDRGNTTSSDTYRGKYPKSELETGYIVTYFRRFSSKIIASLDIHSGLKEVLRPYATAVKENPQDRKMHELGEKMAIKLNKCNFGENYGNNITFHHAYKVDGDAMDWFYEQSKNSYSYTLEIAEEDPGNSYNFVRKEAILYLASNVYDAVETLIEGAVKDPLIKRN